jgi:hypothetical protein
MKTALAESAPIRSIRATRWIKKEVVEAKNACWTPPRLERNAITLYGFMRVRLWKSHRDSYLLGSSIDISAKTAIGYVPESRQVPSTRGTTGQNFDLLV